MAFVQAWVETDPDGGVITVSLLDDYQRQTKTAIRERLEGDPAAPDLTGLIEVGSFSTAPKPRKGTARGYYDTEANILAFGATKREDGRFAISSDTKRLFNCATAAVSRIWSKDHLMVLGHTPLAGTYYDSPSQPATAVATEVNTQIPLPEAGRIKDLRLYVQANLSATTGPLAVTLRINGVDQALTATMPVNSPAGTLVTDLVNIVSVSLADLLSFKIVNGGAGTSGTMGFTFTYEH